MQLKLKVKDGWCSDFYRSQIWYLDVSGKIYSMIGGQNYVLEESTEGNQKLFLLPEGTTGHTLWYIDEDAKTGLTQIRARGSKCIIDASRSYDDIRAENGEKIEALINKKDDTTVVNTNWPTTRWPKHWAVSWSLRYENGPRLQVLERYYDRASQFSTSHIDPCGTDIYNNNAVHHAIQADEFGIKSVRNITVFFRARIITTLIYIYQILNCR